MPVRCRVVWQEQQCPAMVLRRELEAHEMSCDLRAVACKGGCGTELCARQEAEHRCVPLLSALLARLTDDFRKTRADLDATRIGMASAATKLDEKTAEVVSTRIHLREALALLEAALDTALGGDLPHCGAQLDQTARTLGDLKPHLHRLKVTSHTYHIRMALSLPMR